MTKTPTARPTSATVKDRIVGALLAGLDANGYPQDCEIISWPANQGAPRFIFKLNSDEPRNTRYFTVSVSETR